MLPGWRYGRDSVIQQTNQAYRQALDALADLSPSQRQRVFAVFFPKIHIYLETAWQLHDRIPYQTGYQRKPFRAPDQPALLAHTRKSWFSGILGQLRGYDPDIQWLAAWAPYLGYYSNNIALLLAAAIDTWDDDGQEVYQILLASANGEHQVGTMGCHVVAALLLASRPEGWVFIERLLLAAQRQEGLRQVILETVDCAHPQAFRRMLALILEHDLVRFAAVVRAVDVWFGFQWDTAQQKIIRQTLTDTYQFLEDPQLGEVALSSAPISSVCWLSLKPVPCYTPCLKMKKSR
jgi:hypothetical protein